VLGVLAIGWGAQAVTWVGALMRIGGGAATRDEWGYELTIRATQTALIIWTLATPRTALVPLGSSVVVALLLAYSMGHALAIAGRRTLGNAWGIGTRPPVAGAPMVRNGVYRLIPHPIYVGSGIAIGAQAVLLQNTPGVLLLAAAIVVIAWKIARENQWLRE